MTDTDQNRTLLGLTVQIVSAHVQNHLIPAADLPGLIQRVYAALSTAGTAPKAEMAERPAAVAPVKRSIYPDYIICLEDGRKLKTLKRHLRSTYDMSPEQYREKWGLAADYPMVAPNYAERRSVLAKQTGLGRKATDPSPAAIAPEATREAAPARGEQVTAAPIQAVPIPAPIPTMIPATQAAKPAREPRVAEKMVQAAPSPAQAKAAEPVPEAPRRAELSASSVFANFTNKLPEPEVAADDTAGMEASLRKKTRKPFSKQLSRTMR